MQAPSSQVAPDSQAPHTLPQPSAPHCFPAHFGSQTQVPPWQLDPSAQVPHSAPHTLKPQVLGPHSADKRSKRAVPEAGKGMRNLDTWRQLASVRSSLEHDAAARAQLDQDPAAYFKAAGLDELAPSGEQAALSDLEQQLVEFASLDSEFSDDRRHGGSMVVGPVAAGCAAAVTGVVGGVEAAVVGQVVAYEQAYIGTRDWEGNNPS